MSATRSDAEQVLDLLGPDSGVRLRRFFGGWSLLRAGQQIGIVMDTVYAKVDTARRAHWRESGSRPFSYQANGRTVQVEAYWSVPEGALDDPDLLRRLLSGDHDPG